jgi:hypothetical protein
MDLFRIWLHATGTAKDNNTMCYQPTKQLSKRNSSQEQRRRRDALNRRKSFNGMFINVSIGKSHRPAFQEEFSTPFHQMIHPLSSWSPPSPPAGEKSRLADLAIPVYEENDSTNTAADESETKNY